MGVQGAVRAEGSSRCRDVGLFWQVRVFALLSWAGLWVFTVFSDGGV